MGDRGRRVRRGRHLALVVQNGVVVLAAARTFGTGTVGAVGWALGHHRVVVGGV